MNDQKTTRFPKGKNPRLTAATLLLAILAAGVLFFAWFVVSRAEREMRADLLQQTRLVAQAVNIERVQALSGTEADLGSPHYLQLKEQLAAVRSANPQCRFLYTYRPQGRRHVFLLRGQRAGHIEGLLPAWAGL